MQLSGMQARWGAGLLKAPTIPVGLVVGMRY
jgi:hypothetical protein